MQVQLHTDKSLEPGDGLAQQVEATVRTALRRWAERVTRVEVHLNDLNSHKGGAADKRCLMEARLGGLQPVAVSNRAGTVEEAVAGAADKLTRSLESTLGRLSDR
ncbi:MAG: HPF/RaiA family ribosome-associated protein [Vicinamibacterales bacterium]